MNSVVLVESQGSCALVRIVRLQKFDRRNNMIFTVHFNRLIDENTPLEQLGGSVQKRVFFCTLPPRAVHDRNLPTRSLQVPESYENFLRRRVKVRSIVTGLDCVTMMSEMTIAVIVVSASSCHHLTRSDSG